MAVQHGAPIDSRVLPGQENGMPRPPISVLLVDDYPAIRVALERALTAAGFRVVGQAKTGAEGVAKARESHPDIVLMDVRMPDMDGLTATERIKAEAAATAVVIYTGYPDLEYVRRAIAAGAAGYLVKGGPLLDLVAALRGLVEGASLVDAALLAQVLQEVKPGGSQRVSAAAPELSDLELACLRLLAAGLSNREIGERVNYSTGSVKNLVRSIMDKLSASDRTQAAVTGAKLGLV